MANKFAVFIQECTSTPLGPLWVGVTSQGLAAVGFCSSEAEFRQELARQGYHSVQYDLTLTSEYVRQIQEYLQGSRRSFDFPIDWSALTPFQAQALQATFAIPYGQVKTYGEIARQIGKPRAARAVGRAQATNPMPLVIPCHRVLGSDGALHGYGGRGGLNTKRWLLEMEGKQQP